MPPGPRGRIPLNDVREPSSPTPASPPSAGGAAAPLLRRPPGRILLVRLSAIGDVVMASPLAGALRRTFPNARIAWLVEETSLPFDTADELAGMTEDVFLPQLPADTFPYLNESAAVLFAAGYDPSEEFVFGLDLILAALEPLRTPA